MPATFILSLGLAAACLAGINLYLILFLLGLGLRAEWLPAAGLQGIEILGNPVVLTVVLLLYLLEAVTDKVPLVDSLWDILHSVIRPAGAVILALSIMGEAEPAYKVIAGVLAGIAGLSTHLAKTALRLRINASPEVHTNILTSLAEDAVVTGLFFLTIHHPLSGLITCGSLVLVILLLMPRLNAGVRANLFLMWRKLRLPGGVLATRSVNIPSRLRPEQDMLVAAETVLPRHTVLWAVRGVTGRARGVPGLRANIFGTLVAVQELPASLVFIGRRWFRQHAVRIPLQGCEVRHEGGFISEDLVIYSRQEKIHAVFRFTRASAALVSQLEQDLMERLGLRTSEGARSPHNPVAIDPSPPPAPDIIPEPPLIRPRAETSPVPPAGEVAPFPVRSMESIIAEGSNNHAPLPVRGD